MLLLQVSCPTRLGGSSSLACRRLTDELSRPGLEAVAAAAYKTTHDQQFPLVTTD